MKSAIELAMERSGGGDKRKLTDTEKKEIAEIRSKAKAKVAELEIMFAQKSALIAGPELDALKERHFGEIKKVERKREAEAEKVRERK